MEKKNVVFLTVLAIATLLTAVVGTTFAFFTATVTGNDTAQETTVTTATLGVEYSDGAQINATNIAPGWTSSAKTITVTNNSSIAVNYDINWTAVSNTFVTGTWNEDTFTKTADGNSNFKYTLYEDSTSGTVVATGAMPTANGALISNKSIAAKTGNTPTVHTYVLVVEYEDTQTKQDENQGKAFSSKLQVSVRNVGA